MASDKEYLKFVLEKCDGLSARAMMGEYVLYYASKVVGGIYDNRLLVKATAVAKELMSDAAFALPYEGAKAMLFVDAVEDGAFLKELFAAVSGALPSVKGRK